MPNLKITAYLKPTCGWSNGVRAVLKKYNLPYVDRDIINDPASYEEMIRKSGQPLSPCVEINGQMLADISGDEVEAWLTQTGLVTPSDAPAGSPTGAGCAHEAPQASAVDFRS
ncbi:MAG: glutaredoxin [Verrucomicrobia bacterium]|nr:glutaredoxin [Verrucomicrobiota bacterium]